MIEYFCFQRHKRGGGCQPQNENDKEYENIDESTEQNEFVEGDNEGFIPDMEDPMPVFDVVKLLTENPFEEVDILVVTGDV